MTISIINQSPFKSEDQKKFACLHFQSQCKKHRNFKRSNHISNFEAVHLNYIIIFKK